MTRLMRGMVLALALSACTDTDQESGKAAAQAKLPPADVAAGKAFAARDCKGCHDLDGRGAAPAIPHLAAQHEGYLLAALTAYREGKRMHAALREVASHMTEADARNVAAYFASLPPIQTAGVKQSAFVSPYDHGKALAGECAQCHGADGNSRIPGTPNLAGQQPHYFVLAVQKYLNRERAAAPMHALLPGLSKPDLESLALYFASQTPAQRAAPPMGDAAAGEPLSAVCGGCHGSHGVSTDTSTPSLASQDPLYLSNAIKSYRTTRKRESMRAYVTGLKEKDIQDIAAFYSVQESRAAESGQTLIKDLTDKCQRCHAAEADIAGMVVPKIRGQDRDYLIMALRAYRDDRRESSMMHKMSLPYSDAVIESLASAYASQPAR